MFIQRLRASTRDTVPVAARELPWHFFMYVGIVPMYIYVGVWLSVRRNGLPSGLYVATAETTVFRIINHLASWMALQSLAGWRRPPRVHQRSGELRSGATWGHCDSARTLELQKDPRRYTRQSCPVG
jgi:hypothetical protein